MTSALSNPQQSSTQAEILRVSGGKRLKGLFAETLQNQPLVTVITAVYNGHSFLAGCLDSVLRQDHPNIEHLVLDGGSNDGTVDVLREYDDQIAMWRSEPDLGVYDAWNKALLEARGEWICFLGVDDEFLPGAVSAYMALAATNPEAEYLCSRVKVIHSSGYERTIGRPWTWKQFSRWMCTAHAGSMHRRSLLTRLGKYDTSYRSAADYELLLREGPQLKSAYMPLTTVIMRSGGVSCTREALKEEARAKVAAGKRNKMLASMEMLLANAKYTLRPLRNALARVMLR